MPFTVEEFKDLMKLLEERPEWRTELRRLLLTEDLLALPQVVRELAERMGSMAEQGESLTRQTYTLTEQVVALTKQMSVLASQVDALAGQMEVLARRVDSLAEQMQALTQRVDSLAEQMGTLSLKVDDLIRWQRGEAGRRDGERYERDVVKDAPYLFSGGQGGATDDPLVRAKLSEWLKPILNGEKMLEPDERPTLSDLLWWKGEEVVVVEVSLKVKGRDVERAIKRARTLQSAGVQANPAVIGEDWANLEAREQAKERGVLWFVGGTPSESFLAFRRLHI
jgi:chaperonin cofactor prefoldin